MDVKGLKGEYMNEFKELIKNLRVRLEMSVEELKKFEDKGDVNAGEMAIWNVHYVWNGKEYGDLENKLKEKGYKSNI